MRTVLHIGLPKTGTTALQSCFHASYDTLLEHGVLYPKCGEGLRFRNHGLMLKAVGPLPRSLRHQGPKIVQEWHTTFVRSVRSQIVAEKPESVVLSTESLGRHLNAMARKRLRGELKDVGVGDVEIAVYLRRPSSDFLSSLQQHLKVFRELKQPSVRKYRGILEGYAATFGPGNIKPRVFDRTCLVGGDIVADFCASYIAEANVDAARLVPGSLTNETMSAESMDIVTRYRQALEAENDDMHTRGSRSLRDTLRRAEASVGATRPRLRARIADAIDFSSPDILWLRDTYGLEFPDLDYARLESQGSAPVPEVEYTLDDLVEIDPDVRAGLVHEVSRSEWAKQMDSRRAWVTDLMRETS